MNLYYSIIIMVKGIFFYFFFFIQGYNVAVNSSFFFPFTFFCTISFLYLPTIPHSLPFLFVSSSPHIIFLHNSFCATLLLCFSHPVTKHHINEPQVLNSTLPQHIKVLLGVPFVVYYFQDILIYIY